MPCTPEEAAELAKLVVNNKMGETASFPLSIDMEEAVGQSTAAVMTRNKLGWFPTLRTQRGALGDELAVRAVDPMARSLTETHNVSAKLFKEWNDATNGISSGFGWFRHVSTENRTELTKALGFTNKEGKFVGDRTMFTPQIIDAAEKTRPIYNRLYKEYGMDDELFRNYYWPVVQQRPSGIFYNPSDAPAERAFRDLLTPEQVKFYHEIERKGHVFTPDMDAFNQFAHYVHAIGRAKILKPAIEKIENDVVNPYFNLQYVRKANGNLGIVSDDNVGHGLWKELVHNVFGGPTPLDLTMTRTLQQIAGTFGKTTDVRAMYQIAHGLNSAFYAGAMGAPIIGGRPASVIRQLVQLVPTYAELGGKYTMQGITKALQRGENGGLSPMQQLMEKNLISSPLEGLADSMGLARGVGRHISTIAENSLHLFSSVDRFTRGVTAFGAEAKFIDYESRGILNKLSMRKEAKDEVTRLISQGKRDDALDAYMMETVNNLQYSYGPANRPKVFRGALGNLVGALMSYPMNSFEMVRMFGKRAFFEEEKDPRPLIRLTLATAGLMMAGSEFLNADLKSAFLLGAMPHSLAFPKTALDTFQAGNSLYDWGVGSLFNTGETDFHKHERIQNLNNVARDLRPFVPGYMFFFEDVPRTADSGSLARMLAMTPKADVINEEAKQRARAQRQERGGSEVGGLSRLKGL